MPSYTLTCDNGQTLNMTICDPNANIETEIEKLVAQFPPTPGEGEPWPPGWPNPLPTKVVSYVAD